MANFSGISLPHMWSIKRFMNRIEEEDEQQDELSGSWKKFCIPIEESVDSGKVWNESSYSLCLKKPGKIEDILENSNSFNLSSPLEQHLLKQNKSSKFSKVHSSERH